MSKYELIINILTILIQIAALGGLVWQTKKTFEAERKETTKQFLNEVQLESAKEILKNIDKAFFLITEAGVRVKRENDRLSEKNAGKVNDRKIIRDDKGAEIIPFYDSVLEHINRSDFFRLTYEAELSLNNIDIYIYFIPDLKEQHKSIKTELSEFRYLSRSVLDVSYPSETAHRDSIDKQVSLQKMISSYRKDLISLYRVKINDLNNTF